jgi:hypothetical protein
VTMPPPDDDLASQHTRTRARRPGWLERLLGGFTSSSSGASDDVAPGEPAPERIGRYRILQKLGQGGMGVVYEAEDPSLGRRVALKTITHPDEESRQRFRREARAAASVSHPHACQIFEIGEDTGRLFIAMELLDGEPLSERLKRGPFLTLSEASRAAVFKNLDGAFDPEEIFFVGMQAARLAMPEATEILGQAVDAGYPAWDALTRHPWIAPVRGVPGFADVLRRAEQARQRAQDAFRDAGGQTLLGLR